MYFFMAKNTTFVLSTQRSTAALKANVLPSNVYAAHVAKFAAERSSTSVPASNQAKKLPTAAQQSMMNGLGALCRRTLFMRRSQQQINNEPREHQYLSAASSTCSQPSHLAFCMSCCHELPHAQTFALLATLPRITCPCPPAYLTITPVPGIRLLR
ncbi:hypothetical protein Vretimale_12965 [Volvox reticuliferus]|nr:hypothetical protein Vretimale_12965 [Volvox reticuliferus]